MFCLFVFNIRQNGWTDRVQFFCATQRAGKVFGWSNFQKCASNKFRLKLFENSRNFCLFLFYNVYKEKMFTNKIEDGRNRHKSQYFKFFTKRERAVSTFFIMYKKILLKSSKITPLIVLLYVFFIYRCSANVKFTLIIIKFWWLMSHTSWNI